MGRVKRPYGTWSRRMLEGLKRTGHFKVEAFLQWLGARRIEIDRTLVSHWVAGRSHLPADLLPYLAEFTGRPDLVFGPFLREVGCEPVRVPQARASEAELIEAMLAMGGLIGHLQQVLVEARAPGSPDGPALSAEERAHLAEHLDHLLQQTADFRARLRG